MILTGQAAWDKMFGVSTTIYGLVLLETNLLYPRLVKFLHVHVTLGANALVK